MYKSDNNNKNAHVISEGLGLHDRHRICRALRHLENRLKFVLKGDRHLGARNDGGRVGKRRANEIGERALAEKFALDVGFRTDENGERKRDFFPDELNVVFCRHSDVVAEAIAFCCHRISAQLTLFGNSLKLKTFKIK